MGFNLGFKGLKCSVEIPTRCGFVIEFIVPKCFWKLNMFRAAHRSSSGALNCICSLWFIYTCGDRPLPSLDNGRSPHGYINQRLQIQFRAPDDERCARSKHVEPLKKLRNNKFYYKAASCWYFYWVIYDARIHEYQILDHISLSFFLAWKYFQAKLVLKLETRILCSVTFFWNLAAYENVENDVARGRPQMTICQHASQRRAGTWADQSSTWDHVT